MVGRYHELVRLKDDSILGPFSQRELTRATMGPFARGMSNEDPNRLSPPVLDAMGVTPSEFKSLLDANPDAKAMLTQPEAETLYAYLRGSQKYDIHTLNNLFAELASGFRSRMQAAEQKAQQAKATARRPFSAGSPPRPRRMAPGSPGWPHGHDGPGNTTPSPLGYETGPADQGEPSNQGVSSWWLEGGKT